MTDANRREIDERLADWVDGRMSERERERFLGELRVNPQLQRDVEQYERTVGTVRAALRAPTAPTPMAARVLAAIAAERVAPVRASTGWTWRHGLLSLASAAALLACAWWIDGWSQSEPGVTTVAKAYGAREFDFAEVDAPPPADPAAASEQPDAAAALSSLEAKAEAPAMKKADAPVPDIAKERGDKEAIEERRVAVDGSRVDGDKLAAPKQPDVNQNRELELFQRAVPAPGSPAGPGARGGGGPATAASAEPAGPATGGPGSAKGPTPPAEKGRGLGAVPDQAAGNGPADRAPLTEEPRGQPARSELVGEPARKPESPQAPAAAAPATPEPKPLAAEPARGEPMLAFVLLEGDAVVTRKESQEAGRSASKSADAKSGESKDAPRSVGAANDTKAGEPSPRRARGAAKDSGDERAGAAPTTLDAAALRRQIDQFLAAAADTTAEPAALRWVTRSGAVDVSPWLGEVQESLVRDRAARRAVEDAEKAKDSNKDAQKDQDTDRFRAAKPAPVERTWLVEGSKADVQEVLARLRAFADAHRLTMHPGEVPAPRDTLRDAQREPLRDGEAAEDERKVAPSPSASTYGFSTGLRAAERTRIVLRLRLYPR